MIEDRSEELAASLEHEEGYSRDANGNIIKVKVY